MCQVRCWRWLFGNKTPISLSVGVKGSALALVVRQ
jgi:hypothetical protein